MENSKTKKTWIFAGAQTIDGTLVNTFETSSKRKAAKQLKDDARGFYKHLENHKLASENTKVFVWIKNNDVESSHA